MRARVVVVLLIALTSGLLTSEANEDSEAENSETERLSPVTQAVGKLSKVVDETQEHGTPVTLQGALDPLLDAIRRVESGQVSVKDALSSVSLQLQQELESLKSISDELSSNISLVRESQAIIQNELSVLSSDLDELHSEFEAKATALESGLASSRRLAICLAVLLFLLIVFLALFLYQLRKISHALSEDSTNDAETCSDMSVLSERLQRMDAKPDNIGKSGKSQIGMGTGLLSQHRVISEYQPPACASAPEMIAVSSSVLDQMQQKACAAEEIRPGCEVGFGFVGHVIGDWDELHIGGLLNPGEKARYSHASFFEDLEAQASELKRFQFLDPQVGYLGFAHRHPGAMKRPTSGDRKTDIANVLDAFKENYRGGFVYSILTQQTVGWEVSWYYMPRRELGYFPFKPRIMEAPSLPKAWNSKLGYRVQAEVGCLCECAETVSLGTLERGEFGYLSILLVSRRWNGSCLLFVIPEDYPLLPPSVYLQGPQGQTKEHKSLFLSNWRSTYSLANIVFEFDEAS